MHILVLFIIIITFILLLCAYYIFRVDLENNMSFIVDNFSYTKKKFKLITLETREMPLLTLHNENMNRYCNLHSYDYIFLNHYESIYPIYWQKLELLLKEIDNCDYIVWVDSDCIFIKENIPLEYLINNMDIYIGYDAFSISGLIMNAGFFIIKNNDNGKSFLQDCINLLINNKQCQKDGNYVCSGSWAGACYEQGVMNILLKDKYKNNVKILDKNILLNIGEPGNSYIHHFFGPDKTKVFDYFNNLKQNTYKYLIVLSNKNNLSLWLKISNDNFKITNKNINTNNYDYIIYVNGRYFIYDLEYYLRKYITYNINYIYSYNKKDIYGYKINKILKDTCILPKINIKPTLNEDNQLVYYL